jgi:hypothetical protein
VARTLNATHTAKSIAPTMIETPITPLGPFGISSDAKTPSAISKPAIVIPEIINDRSTRMLRELGGLGNVVSLDERSLHSLKPNNRQFCRRSIGADLYLSDGLCDCSQGDCPSSALDHHFRPAIAAGKALHVVVDVELASATRTIQANELVGHPGLRILDYRHPAVVTLRLWTLRVHRFSHEGCAPSTRESPIKPFARLPTEFGNCAE